MGAQGECSIQFPRNPFQATILLIQGLKCPQKATDKTGQRAFLSQSVRDAERQRDPGNDQDHVGFLLSVGREELLICSCFLCGIKERKLFSGKISTHPLLSPVITAEQNMGPPSHSQRPPGIELLPPAALGDGAAIQGLTKVISLETAWNSCG